jgi:hypothetical protein
MKCKLFLPGFILFLYSCTFEEETGYYNDSFGVVNLSENKALYIKSDEGETLIPNQSISDFVLSGDRVWVSYAVEKENVNKDTLTISPYRITPITPMILQKATTLKDDGIELLTIWVAQDFLTFDFKVRSNDHNRLKTHEYALVSLQTEIIDTLFINLVHDAGNDNAGTLYRTAVTLKLNELKTAKDSIIFAIDYNTLGGVKQREYRIYKKNQTEALPEIKNNVNIINRVNLKRK